MPKIVQYNLPPGGTILDVAANNATALDIEQAGADYITVDTTGSGSVIIGKTLTLEAGFATSGNIEIENASPTLTLDNTTAEDINSGRESQINFTGLKDDETAHTLGFLRFAHDGTGDDTKGIFSVNLNTGSSVIGRLVMYSNGNVITDGSFGIGNGSAGGPSHTFQNDNNTGMFGTGSDVIGFSTNGTERLRITSDGKVGINDTSPAYKLVVQASATNEDLVSFNASDGNEALRFEVLGNSGATTWYSASGVNQHRLSARTGSNGMVRLNEQMHDCNFTMGSENSTKMLHVDASLDEVVIIDDNTAIGPEHLDETTFATHTEWDVAGDFSDSGGDATYTHSSGAGTLTQVQADLALALSGDRYYVFTYTVSAVTNDSSNPMAATITTGVAHEAVSLTVTANGTYKTSFRAKASPADFVISATSTTGGNTFTLETVSLKSCGGDLVLGERLNCADAGFNLRIGDVSTGAALGASTGLYNTLLGAKAGEDLNAGSQCTMLGYNAGASYDGQNSGTFVGYCAGQATTSHSNTAVGANALTNAGVSTGNVAIGAGAMGNLYTGQSSVGIGFEAMGTGGACTNSVGIGYHSLLIATGNDSTAVGYNTATSLTSGAGCTFIGKGANTTAAGANGQTVIGADATCDAADTMVLGRETVEVIRSGSNGVCELGTSSFGFKGLILKNAFTNGNTGQGTSFSVTDSNGTPRKHTKLYNGGGLQLGHDETDFYILSTTLRIGANAGNMGTRILSASLTAVNIAFFPEAGTQQVFTMELVQAAASSYTITWPSTATGYSGYYGGTTYSSIPIKWAGGVKHTMSTANDAIDLVQFVMIHGASGARTIYASVIGQAFA